MGPDTDFKTPPRTASGHLPVSSLIIRCVLIGLGAAKSLESGYVDCILSSAYFFLCDPGEALHLCLQNWA